MQRFGRRIGPVAVAIFFGWSLCAGGAWADSFANRLKGAMAADSRPAKDQLRDANRMPVETLSFFGLDAEQSVLEVLPGGGWYTRLLAPALDQTGKLFLGFAARLPDSVRQEPFMKNVTILEIEADFGETDRKGVFAVPAFSFGVEELDAVLTFRNLHNLTGASRIEMARAAFAALKPGGVYGVIDHTRRHNEAGSAENWRRLDPVLVIQEIQGAGFQFEASSNLHARPGDQLDLEVGHENVSGKTDRFTLRFRKPAL